MNNQFDGGEAVLAAFRALGIDYIMSSPGSEWGAVWEALARQKVNGADGPTYLSCWHETLAVDMAIGYTMATGRMQAVMLHAGVGLLQGAVGIHAAFIQNIPMLVLSGEALTYGERADFDPGQQWSQNLSVVGGTHRLVEPYVKWAAQAPSIETLYHSLVRCGEMAQRAPMGPVYLNVPIETQLAAWTPPSRSGAAQPAAPPRAPAPAIANVADLLINAREPVITTEAAGRDPAGYAALLDLADALAIPVIETTSSIFSNFPKDHALHQGTSLTPFAESADVALVVRSRVPWYPSTRRPPHAKVVLIDESPYRAHMVYQNLQADLLLEGDVAFTLDSLAQLARAARVPREAIEARRHRHAARHEKLASAARAAVDQARTHRPIDPIWVVATLNEALPDDAIYVDETITHRGVIDTYLRNKGQGSFYKVRGGLGQGLGHAIGVKLAHRGRTVVSLIGDGALLYNPVTQSLGYAARAGLPILIVVFNNNEYRAMRENQLDYYPDGVGKKHDLFYGAPVDGPDYAALGAPFGAFGRMVEDPAELIPAIEEALGATREGRTAILNVLLSR